MSLTIFCTSLDSNACKYLAFIFITNRIITQSKNKRNERAWYILIGVHESNGKWDAGWHHWIKTKFGKCLHVSFKRVYMYELSIRERAVCRTVNLFTTNFIMWIFMVFWVEAAVVFITNKQQKDQLHTTFYTHGNGAHTFCIFC